jgi:predicted nucleic acid-binding Zn ribbon protein
MTDKPVKKCPRCGKSKAKRLIGSGIGIIFKGSGFYETDYKRKAEPSKQPDETTKKSEGKPEGAFASKKEKSRDLPQSKKTEGNSKKSGKEKDKK